MRGDSQRLSKLGAFTARNAADRIDLAANAAKTDQSLDPRHMLRAMAVVRFPAYIRHEEGRVEANNSMIALLIGGRLSGHMLSLLDGSEAYLTDIFPRLPDIAKLHVAVPTAQALLRSSETHLAHMAIPYSVSIHEDYLNRCIDMVCRARGQAPSTIKPHKRKLGGIYSTLVGLGLDSPPQPMGELFELVRKVRNQIVHENGMIGDVLSFYRGSKQLSDSWQRLAKRELDRRDDAHLHIEAPELFASLGVLKRLADWLNKALQSALDRPTWAAIALEAFGAGDPKGNPDQIARQIRGFIRHNYGALDLTRADLTAAAAARGFPEHWANLKEGSTN